MAEEEEREKKENRRGVDREQGFKFLVTLKSLSLFRLAHTYTDAILTQALSWRRSSFIFAVAVSSANNGNGEDLPESKPGRGRAVIKKKKFRNSYQ